MKKKASAKKENEPLKLLDIARKAGVSTATVSRTLSNPELVSPKTLKKVNTTIEESGYVVNEMARSLRRRKSGVILAMVPSVITSPLASQLVVAMKRKAYESGYMILTANYDHSATLHKQLFSYIYQNRADGILFLGGEDLLQTRHLPGQTPPIIAVNEKIEAMKIPSVAVDGYDAALEIVRYLVGLGHVHLGHIAGPPEKSSSASERLKGFQEGAKNLPDPWIFSTEYNIESGVLAAGKWISLPKKPSAVFCSCDEVALGFLSELHRNGFSVPGDVSIVGFDDIPLAKYCIPPLTTFSQPHEQIGIKAVEMLVDKMNGQKNTDDHLVLKGQLIVRGSTHRPKLRY